MTEITFELNNYFGSNSGNDYKGKIPIHILGYNEFLDGFSAVKQNINPNIVFFPATLAQPERSVVYANTPDFPYDIQFSGGVKTPFSNNVFKCFVRGIGRSYMSVNQYLATKRYKVVNVRVNYVTQIVPINLNLSDLLGNLYLGKSDIQGNFNTNTYNLFSNYSPNEYFGRADGGSGERLKNVSVDVPVDFFMDEFSYIYLDGYSPLVIPNNQVQSTNIFVTLTLDI